jgi:hypothetical protein
VNSWIAFAYHTPDRLYTHYVGQLLESCRRFHVPTDVEVVETVGSWVRNCGQKPAAILRALDRNSRADVAYLDADAQLWAYPALFDTVQGDLAVHYLNGAELISSVMYWRNNVRSRAILTRWIERQRAAPEVWDQKVLQAVLAEDVEAAGAQVTRLPAAYCYIRGLSPDIEKPVIFQHQASCLAHKIAAGWTFDQAISTRR